ncbi:MAG: Asp-tRNA(Asn)/Glu-tRNA(Gln) amidotransferase subunit GatC [Flavobacteriales bacterium]|nr:Glutamyl-tRNA(Gln) amidotransferase subunit C [Flavobacteriales bacterium]MCC6578366.1 Asp-tRNA(Asn)/Glu-tRNA(Gln) amidotransferase subunit GatC [Flavobacteriales bacterium]NUQ14590.1 Asp-tRNA(Asn)/Glu-tRNA(Gln) amidotransferase subunit GatC [Flavobacteriales bacterium]
MKLDDAALDRIAELARLDFSDPDRRAAVLRDMERVLAFVEQLNTVDTRGVEPLVFMTEEENVLRDDVALPGVSKQDALRNAPVKDSDYFKVPRVVDKG